MDGKNVFQIKFVLQDDWMGPESFILTLILKDKRLWCPSTFKSHDLLNKKGKTLEGLKPKDFQELQIFLRFPAISMVKPNLTHKVIIALLIRGRGLKLCQCNVPQENTFLIRMFYISLSRFRQVVVNYDDFIFGQSNLF